MTAEKTYGALVYYPPEGQARRGRYGVSATPPVIMRIKSFLPRVDVSNRGSLFVADTPEVARDLELMCLRWPLLMDDLTAATLEAGAKLHRANEVAVARILAGHAVDRGAVWRVPAMKPREYQQQAADLIAVVNRLLITDSLGLGKTLEGVLTFRDPQALPAALVCQTHLPPQMQREIAKVWPDLKTHIARKGKPYDMTRFGGEPDVLILNYAKLPGWQHELAGWAQTVIFDEIQELRRGETSDKGKAAANIAANALYAIGLTNTPVYNYGNEIWEIINILIPGALGDKEEFAREWKGARTAAGHIKLADPAALATHLRDAGHMLGRTREQVGRELPYGEPVRVPHFVDSDPKALDELSGDSIELAKLILSKGTGRAERFNIAGQLDSQMRQATGIAKAPYVAEFVKMLLDGGEQRIILWGWHRSVYGIWRERLDAYWPVMYTGSESPKQKESSIRAFTEGDARVLIMSLRSGAGIDGLQGYCKTGVFGELDWSPQVHKQDLGRLARDGQMHEVTGYFMVSDHGSDPTIARVLGVKHHQGAPFEDPAAATILAPLSDDTTGRARMLAEDLFRRRGIPIPITDGANT